MFLRGRGVKYLVLGAGKMGYAMAFDLIRSPKVDKVVIADSDENAVKRIQDKLADPKIVPVQLDIKEEKDVAQLMANSDVTISCMPYEFNYELAKLALQSKSHFVDLGGNNDVVEKTFQLDQIAKDQGVTIIPDLGLAPGLVSILAVSAAEVMDEIYDMRIRVGGLPVEPEDQLLEYGQFFSIEGLINEYVEDCTVIRDGEIISVPSLTELEEIEFPKPLGTLEAFTTSGGCSTLPQTYKGRIQHLDYKTIRYPGHCDKINLLKQLGLMDKAEIKIGKHKIAPRAILSHLLNEKLAKNLPDVVVVRVTVTGVKDGEPLQMVWDGIDYGSEADGLTAMGRMTTFPASIIAQMIARGDIKERGVVRQEDVVPTKLFLAELTSRGINITLTDRAPVYS